MSLRGLDALVAEGELDLLYFAARVMTQAGASAQIVGRDTGQTALTAGGGHPDQITLGLNPFEAIRLAMLIARKIGPAVTAAALNHA